MMPGGIDNSLHLPSVESDPRTWTEEERTYVMLHRQEWIQLCLDCNEEADKNKKLLDFVKAKDATF